MEENPKSLSVKLRQLWLYLMELQKKSWLPSLTIGTFFLFSSSFMDFLLSFPSLLSSSTLP
ncbi:hypothetical protein MtrunA17_Chr2g0290881 [Medicago truncatula]|uniref:Transmembrane protein n=1 Tax=Medicago truncatula TaxID=3880 RepID=A0A396J8T3_MEDTR|nr:hypothetical protein MtrunA17_Chr2g0290881 [Medicago truncatula]